tara:strand:- start:494 stop:727 length:234 start_codon:yes stop_codon:yes gene_type:complete
LTFLPIKPYNIFFRRDEMKYRELVQRLSVLKLEEEYTRKVFAATMENINTEKAIIGQTLLGIYKEKDNDTIEPTILP